MSVGCIIEREGEVFKPRKPYQFACLPRIGETIVLETEGDGYPKFSVKNVIHVPDDVEDRPAFTVLHVKRV